MCGKLDVRERRDGRRGGEQVVGGLHVDGWGFSKVLNTFVVLDYMGYVYTVETRNGPERQQLSQQPILKMSLAAGIMAVRAASWGPHARPNWKLDTLGPGNTRNDLDESPRGPRHTPTSASSRFGVANGARLSSRTPPLSNSSPSSKPPGQRSP